MMMQNHFDSAVSNPFEMRLRAVTGVDGVAVANILSAFGPGRDFRSKRDIVPEGKPAESLLVLTEGWACRYRLLRDGRRQIITLLLPGDVCNPDVLAWDRADYGVASLTACTVIDASVTALRTMILRMPDIAQAWMKLILADNAMLAEHNACLGRRSAREHLAHLLCELFLRLKTVGRADVRNFSLPITQEEIGDTLGLTPVHVNRVLQVLRNEGVISFQGHKVTILNRDQLRAEAGFDGRYLHSGADLRLLDSRAPVAGVAAPSAAHSQPART